MKRESESGISLIEVLIVLAVVAVLASISVLSVGAMARGGSAEAEARRLASHVRLAMDDAMVTGQEIALAISPTGYQFQSAAADGDGWAPHRVGLLGEQHDLPSQMQIESAGGRTILIISPEGDGDTATLAFRDGGSEWRVAIDGYDAAVSTGRELTQ